MGRPLVFVHGVISYALFVVTYLFAVGSVGTTFVPKSLDLAPAAPFGTTSAINLGLLGLFALISLPTKRTSPIVRAASTIGVLALLTITPAHVFAQDHSHAGMTADRHSNNALVRAVRDATERFKDVEAATDAEYQLLFGCVSGPDYGAMGLHYVNLGLVFDGGELDAAHPEIILYEPLPNGRLRMTGADFLVIAKDWDDKHPGDPPQLMGQLFHRFEAPNRFGLPDFYTLHVWAWKDSPTGTFSNWHSNVSCDSFTAQ